METRELINNNQPLVSIITPSYNAQRFIKDTFRSIQEQTHTNWEQIIVDDCSTDETISIVEAEAAKDSRIKLFKNTTNRGAGYTRNRAIEEAKGDFIAFLDSDDMWHPQKLEKQVAFMLEKDIYVSNTNFLHMDEEGTFMGIRRKARKEVSYNKLLRNNYIGNLTGMYDAKYLGKIYSPDIRKRQDWALWLEAIEKGGKPCMGLQEDLGFYRIRKVSLSSNKVNLVKHNFIFYNKGMGYSKIGAMYRMVLFFWEYFLFRPSTIEKY